MEYWGQQYLQKRIETNQDFLLKLLNFNIAGYNPLRKWLGIDYKGKIDEISHLSFAYNTEYFKKGNQWYKKQTRVYQQPDLGYKLNWILDSIPEVIIPKYGQPSWGLIQMRLARCAEAVYQPPIMGIKIDNQYPDDNFYLQQLSIYYTYPLIIRSFVRFDLTDLGENITFVEGTLGIYILNVDRSYTACCRMTRTNWTEAATWNKYDGTNAWTTAGGDYTTTGSISLYIEVDKRWYFYSNIKDLIQYCFDNDSKYVNLALVEAGRSMANFYNRDGGSYAPKLTVTYFVTTTAQSTVSLFIPLQLAEEKALQSSLACSTQLEPNRWKKDTTHTQTWVKEQTHNKMYKS